MKEIEYLDADVVVVGGGATQYEWRDAHADDSPYRFFDALLSYFGAKKNAETDLESKYRIRISSPLLSSEGNMLSTITSYADYTLPAFRVRTFLPEGVKAPKQLLMTRDASREVTELPFVYNKEKNAVEYTVPAGLNVFANLLFVQDQAAPMVSVTMPEARRDAAKLATLRPGEKLRLKVRVLNPGRNALPEGKLTLRLPAGWFCSEEEIAVPAISGRGSSEEISVTVQAPATCASRRLRPVNLLYQAGNVSSMPAVEMVWFQKEEQLENPLFD